MILLADTTHESNLGHHAAGNGCDEGRTLHEENRMRNRLVAVLIVMVVAVSGAAAEDAATTLRVWNSDLLNVNSGAKTSDSSPLRPISVVGARNGWFSGKAVVGSSGPIKDLKATASDLKGEGGSIPAARVNIRYGVPWKDMNRRYNPQGMDILLASPPKDRLVIALWVTVNVPKEAKPGTYKGELAVQAAGGTAVMVPIELKVADWTLPDTGQWTTWMELVQSPDTLAVEYGVPLWSDKHWQMIAQSLKLIGEMGSRVVYVPLICHTNNGNEQSMVRWIAKDDGGYEYDFSIMEKYLDLATRHMGKPKMVVVGAWDVYLNTPSGEIIPDDEVKDRRRHVLNNKRMADARRGLRGKGPGVTVVDAGGKNARVINLPRYEDPGSKAVWEPVWKQLRQKLRTRGLEEAMMLGMVSDNWPNRKEVAMLKDISNDLPWVSHSHFSPAVRKGGALYGLARIAYESTVWDITVTLNPARARTYGWKRPAFVVGHYRKAGVNRMTPSQLRGLAEVNITGNQRGIGRLGGDFWWVVKDKRGQRVGTAIDRYPQSLWRNLDMQACLLAPGLSGPVATARYEYMREGVQECEARIQIERALTDEKLRGKLGDELATRCQALLDERQRNLWKAQGLSDEQIESRGTVTNVARSLPRSRSGRGRGGKGREGAGHKWFLSSLWQEQTGKLFALAGEVAAKLRKD
jgi:glycosyl hydrolase family 123